MRNEKFMSGIARFLVVFMMTASVIAPAQAAMMETETLAAPIGADARGALVDKLVSLGVERDEAQGRVAVLSNEQATQVLAKADELPAGAGALGVLGLIFLILIITDLIGVTDIFPFIDKVGD